MNKIQRYITAKPTKNNFKVGQSVYFESGNFEGLTGLIVRVDWESSHPNAIFGYYHKVQLSNGNIGYIEKMEHLRLILKENVHLKTIDDSQFLLTPDIIDHTTIKISPNIPELPDGALIPKDYKYTGKKKYKMVITPDMKLIHPNINPDEVVKISSK